MLSDPLVIMSFVIHDPRLTAKYDLVCAHTVIAEQHATTVFFQRLPLADPKKLAVAVCFRFKSALRALPLNGDAVGEILLMIRDNGFALYPLAQSMELDTGSPHSVTTFVGTLHRLIDWRYKGTWKGEEELAERFIVAIVHHLRWHAFTSGTLSIDSSVRRVSQHPLFERQCLVAVMSFAAVAS